jgi:hypothetical protein
MRRMAVLIASLAINAFTIPAVAAECTSIKGIDASCARWAAAVDGKPADKENTCRAYAASFYQSVMLRQVAASRADGARVLVALDFVVKLSTTCWRRGAAVELTISRQISTREVQMMILFHLITTWMWFKILTASPLPVIGASPS